MRLRHDAAILWTVLFEIQMIVDWVLLQVFSSAVFCLCVFYACILRCLVGEAYMDLYEDVGLMGCFCVWAMRKFLPLYRCVVGSFWRRIEMFSVVFLVFCVSLAYD